MNCKSLARVEIKDADRGEVAAVFSVFDVVDHDMDVTRKGAFTDGAPVLISAFNHQSWGGALPVGKGAIRELDTEAVLEGKFFVDTQAGSDTFKVVKEMGALQEWSYGYDPVKFSFGEFDGKQVRFLETLAVTEVSPVIKGAGIGTRTLTVKSGLKFSEHIAAVLADVDALNVRASEVLALRAEKGKTLAGESADLLERLDVELKRLAELIAAPTPEAEDNDDAVREYLRSIARSHGISA